MMTDELGSLLEWFDLKDELRTGWELRNVDSPESVAAHTWGTAALCLLYADQEDVDRQKAVTMALIHDLGEARTGDIATRAEDGRQTIPTSEKETAERSAVTDLVGPFNDSELLSLWEEYEARDTPTAQFVKDMDLVDNCLQALKYERQNRYDEAETTDHFTEFENLDEFFATAAPRFQTEFGQDLFKQIKSEYESEIGRPCQL
ncbi:HD domain-containing protein (plasmid) [Haloarcula sp. NS06]|uniref:5'-deoxynucleotidase n=7 Tax=Halobacteriales TaxID=2235 RepID=O52019_HALSA|nr:MULTISPECIES: HD family hydrolase [Halobacteria]TYO73938.1 putative hydrolases of HD superfamily [Halobacterium salinarum DSM 3754]AAC82899.1 unknown [Halobacterium salinarum NRC-1]MDL0119929.1 HD family hydrolase [Halobacterium salinarum]MDL0123403.1 HD family hydrolase [Halobacterium salinarum]MDL0129186.1 HD family hydrolase [Halobacterium salinarum]